MPKVNQQGMHKGQLSQKRYRELARERYHSDGEIEIDEGATVSISADSGAYVQAWVWVDDPGHDVLAGARRRMLGTPRVGAPATK
jgi:hypothetical protein